MSHAAVFLAISHVMPPKTTRGAKVSEASELRRSQDKSKQAAVPAEISANAVASAAQVTPPQKRSGKASASTADAPQTQPNHSQQIAADKSATASVDSQPKKEGKKRWSKTKPRSEIAVHSFITSVAHHPVRLQQNK